MCVACVLQMLVSYNNNEFEWFVGGRQPSGSRRPQKLAGWQPSGKIILLSYAISILLLTMETHNRYKSNHHHPRRSSIMIYLIGNLQLSTHSFRNQNYCLIIFVVKIELRSEWDKGCQEISLKVRQCSVYYTIYLKLFLDALEL